MVQDPRKVDEINTFVTYIDIALSSLHNDLKSVLTRLDFGHVLTTISGSNEKAINIVELTQNNTLE